MELIHNMNNNMILEMTKDINTINKKAEVRKTVTKWEKTGLLEGLKGQTRENIAQLLENQAKECRRTLMMEQTVVGDIAGFNKIAFPLVRRVFAQLVANNIVSVQPMSQPSGLIFFLDFTYERTKAGQTAGRSVYGDRQPVIDAKSQGIGAQLGTGGLYGYQALGYANREFAIGITTPTYNGLTAQSGSVSGTLSGYVFTLVDGSVTDKLARYSMYPVLSGSVNYETGSGSTFRGLTAIKSLTGYNFQANVDRMKTELTSSGSVTLWSNTFLDTASFSALNTIVLVGRADTITRDAAAQSGVQTLHGDFELTNEMPQLNAKILQVYIGSQSKRLRTVWTPEMAQDLNAYMSLDAEVELTNILSEEIAAELDREIIADLLMVASVKAAWSRKIGKYIYVDANGRVQEASAAGTTFTYQSFHGTQDDWNNTLGHVMSAVSNRVYKLNLRRGCNWIITSMQGSSIIENMGKLFKADETNQEEQQFSLGTEKIGTLGGRWTIYKDPLFPEAKMLMGYKGTSQLEAGYIWAPYIPLLVTPTIFDPNNFSPIKGVMTRNGRQTIRPEYYGTIDILDMGFYTFLQ